MEQLKLFYIYDLVCNSATMGDDSMWIHSLIWTCYSMSDFCCRVSGSVAHLFNIAVLVTGLHHRTQPPRLSLQDSSLICLCLTNRRERGLDAFFAHSVV